LTTTTGLGSEEEIGADVRMDKEKGKKKTAAQETKKISTNIKTYGLVEFKQNLCPDVNRGLNLTYSFNFRVFCEKIALINIFLIPLFRKSSIYHFFPHFRVFREIKAFNSV
jgi:hypothetical protein